MRKKLLYVIAGLLIGLFTLSAAVVLTAPCSASSAAKYCADTSPEDDACPGDCPDGDYRCHITKLNKCKCEKVN